MPDHLETNMFPAVATVYHCWQCWQAHDHFVSLLWWYQRSTAVVLCAWLIAANGHSAEDAIKILVTKRPSLRPWRHRDYVLEALWVVERQRSEWQQDFTLGTA